jgi:hypothetical protein
VWQHKKIHWPLWNGVAINYNQLLI